MYHQILAAGDGSLNAHVATRDAIVLAHTCVAQLFVAGMITPQMTGADEGTMAQSAGRLVHEAESVRCQPTASFLPMRGVQPWHQA